MSAKKDTIAATAARVAQAKRDADKASAAVESAQWESRAVTAVLSYARTDAQTADVARTLYAATRHGVTLAKLADVIQEAADRADSLASGFSRARIGQLTKAVSHVESVGVTVPESGDIEPVVSTLIARMTTAVSGSTSGIPADVVKDILASVKDVPEHLRAQTLSNALYAEIDSHELTTEYRAARKAERENEKARGEELPLSATAVVSALSRMRHLLAESKYSDADRATIHGALNDAVSALRAYAVAEHAMLADADVELPALV